MDSRSFLNKHFKDDFRNTVEEILEDVWKVSEPCGETLERIGEVLSGSVSATAFDELGDSFKGDSAITKGNPIPINTYPIGTITNDIHRDFLGVCYGNNKIDSVLKAAANQCKKMCKKYGDHADKTVMILTNKWNEPDFQRNFAGTFINFAIKCNIVFIFILVTSSGMTMIPFLPLNRGRLSALQNEKVDYGKNNTGSNRRQELPDGSHDNPVVLPSENDRSGNLHSGTGNYGRKYYDSYISQELLNIFDGRPITCKYKADESNLNDKQDYIFEIAIDKNSIWSNNLTGASGKIHKKTVKKFIKEIAGFINLSDDQIKIINSNNSPTHIVEVFGYNLRKEFWWNSTNRVLFENLENAFKELIKKALK